MPASNRAATPEPAPKRTDSPAVWPLVIADLAALDAPEWLRQVMADDMRDRDAFGREKYGTPLQVENDRDASTDAYQEALDLAVYLRQKAEQTDLAYWHALSGQAVGMAAAIRCQIALEAEGRNA
jgi:hypothetical protein